MAFYKLPIEQVLVLSDDISLEPGRLRIRAKGSAGGHNGLKNIIYLTGKDTFPRVKIGVGTKPSQWNLADWVLAQPHTEEMEKIREAVQQIPEICEWIVAGQLGEAMNRFNSFQG